MFIHAVLERVGVLLLTTSFGWAFQAEVKVLATDVLKCFTICFAPLFLNMSIHNYIYIYIYHYFALVVY